MFFAVHNSEVNLHKTINRNTVEPVLNCVEKAANSKIVEGHDKFQCSLEVHFLASENDIVVHNHDGKVLMTVSDFI